MGQRLQLHSILSAIPGVKKAYFQPPETVKMDYPCIVYQRSDIETEFADDNPYISNVQYQVTVIDADPDSSIPGKISVMPKCTFDRGFTASNLNHTVFNLFY